MQKAELLVALFLAFNYYNKQKLILGKVMEFIRTKNIN